MRDVFEQLLAGTRLPRFARAAYAIGRAEPMDIPRAMAEALRGRGVLRRVLPGMRVAITAGSREMGDMVPIFQSIVAEVKACGAEPFIVPSMGSHGGATAQGQRAVLEGYGLTEAALGCAIVSSMETVRIGDSASGLPVHIDRNAFEADGIVVVGRVKPHTDFRGRVESGLMKMMAIGLGKQHGANICHSMGFGRMAQNVWEFGSCVLEKANVLFAVSVIEDFYHHTLRLDAVPAERIPQEEPGLLEIARVQLPGLPFDDLDSLIVQEIGKDISGSGMDSNVTGRSPYLPPARPHVKSVAVLDITDKSHGNGTGLGLAEVTTRRAFEKFSFEATYPNAITSRGAEGCRIPVVMPSDRLAFKLAMRLSFSGQDPRAFRAVWIRNTLSLEQFHISEALLEEAVRDPAVTILSDPEELSFDSKGNLGEKYWA
ncbi:MAG: DUF2088 domain-containing protein [Clostridia bacterium]|nr:DUF2088 domain-containing protein [Clostridia bacterium]